MEGREQRPIGTGGDHCKHRVRGARRLAKWGLRTLAMTIERRRDGDSGSQLSVSIGGHSYVYATFTESNWDKGLFVATDELVPAGSRIKVRLQLHDGESPIDLAGIVQWHRRFHPRGMGVRLDGVRESDWLRIEVAFLRR